MGTHRPLDKQSRNHKPARYSFNLLRNYKKRYLNSYLHREYSHASIKYLEVGLCRSQASEPPRPGLIKERSQFEFQTIHLVERENEAYQLKYWQNLCRGYIGRARYKHWPATFDSNKDSRHNGRSLSPSSVMIHDGEMYNLIYRSMYRLHTNSSRVMNTSWPMIQDDLRTEHG